jgi:membrane-associated phospholipid phosphatase
MSRLIATTLAAVIVAASPAASRAQDTARARSDSLIPDSRLFIRSDLYVLSGFVGATVAMFPLDRGLARSVRRDHLVDNGTLAAIEETLNFAGGPGAILAGGALYVFGRIAHKRRVAHVALHATEAMVAGLAASGALKMLAGRARPYASADTTPHDFGFGRGFQGERFQAFPSGHSTVSFAAAAALTSESAALSSRARWLTGSLLFGSATIVGLSRMYADRHWASDVVVGAAIGTFAGLKTVRFNHTRSGNRFDRWLLGEPTTALRLLPGASGSTLFGVDVRY